LLAFASGALGTPFEKTVPEKPTFLTEKGPSEGDFLKA
jgi:hypothetical protein